MGGDLDISSTPGAGSCFKVNLMMSRVTEPLILTPALRHIEGYSGDRKIIMVVDDDPIHRGLMAELLPPLGFTLFESPDALDCLEVVKSITPDIFLLDVSMSGMDGLTLASHLRAQGFKQPIIMISADAQERHRNMQHLSDHNAYLVKPINHRQLLDKIGNLLTLHWLHSKADEAETQSAVLIPLTDLTALSNNELARELVACAELGYKRGVQNKLDEMTQKGLINEPARKYLKSLLDVMQFNLIVRSFQPVKPPLLDTPDAGDNTSVSGS
jgi:CheY-like chemotaxis protein